METTDLVLQEATKTLPTLVQITTRFSESFKLCSQIEDAIGNLLQDELFAKDADFLLSAHASISKNAAAMLECSRRYVDSLVRLYGVAYNPHKTASSSEAEEKNASPGQPVTEDEIDSSLGNSKFGDA